MIHSHQTRLTEHRETLSSLYTNIERTKNAYVGVREDIYGEYTYIRVCPSLNRGVQMSCIVDLHWDYRGPREREEDGAKKDTKTGEAKNSSQL